MTPFATNHGDRPRDKNGSKRLELAVKEKHLKEKTSIQNKNIYFIYI